MTKKNPKAVSNSDWEPVAPTKKRHDTPPPAPLFPDKEDAIVAKLERGAWATLKDKNAALKKQLEPIFNLFYVGIPSALKDLENKLNSFKVDKTNNSIIRNKVNTLWQDCQDDLKLILETAYLDVMRQELSSDEDKQKWDIKRLESLLDQNFLTAKAKKRILRTKISHYIKGVQILKKHKQRMQQEQKKFQGNPLLADSLRSLQQYKATLDLLHYNLINPLLETEASEREQSIAKKDAQIFQNFARDIFHQKPILSARLRSLLALIYTETEKVFYAKKDYILEQQAKADKTRQTLTYQTAEEKEERLLKLLKNQTPAIQGEQMDFTFLPTALQEFSKYPEEYQQEAVKKMQRVMNIPLEMGSRTVVAGHQVIDKMKGYDLHKIRVINYNIGEDNLPRIMLKPLPSQGDRERWCVVGFSDEAHQSRQYARFSKREVLPWPTDPKQIVIFNPSQIVSDPNPTPVVTPRGGNGGNGR